MREADHGPNGMERPSLGDPMSPVHRNASMARGRYAEAPPAASSPRLSDHRVESDMALAANPLDVSCPRCGGAFGRACWALDKPRIKGRPQKRRAFHIERCRKAREVRAWAKRTRRGA